MNICKKLIIIYSFKNLHANQHDDLARATTILYNSSPLYSTNPPFPLNLLFSKQSRNLFSFS